MSTGTGIAPFLSILRTEAPWQRYRNVVLVHAVRHARELVYRELIDRFDSGELQYVTFVSREQRRGSLAGRIPAAIARRPARGRGGPALAAETLAGHAVRQPATCSRTPPRRWSSAACASIGAAAPGQITVESFW